MKEQIIRDGRKTCFRLPAAEDAAGSYRLQILNNNRPEQLLNIRLVYDGNEKFWEYAISGLVSLADAGRPELLFDYLHAIVFSLERLADSIGEYLLEADELYLDPEHVFLQAETGRVFFCYRPGTKEPSGAGLMRLMEFFMKEMNPTRENEVLLLYGLFQKSREPNVTLKTLAEYWRELEKQFDQKEEKSEKKAVYEEEASDEEDDAVYQALGLRRNRSERMLFEEWKENQEPIETEPEAREEIPEIRMYLKPERPLAGRGRKRTEGFSEKLGRQIREHSFELGIGAIVAAGVVLFLFM